MFLHSNVKNKSKYGQKVCANTSQKCTQMKIKMRQNNAENEKKKTSMANKQMRINSTPLIIRKLLMSAEHHSTVLRWQGLRINTTKLWYHGVQLEFLGNIVGARAKGYIF